MSAVFLHRRRILFGDCDPGGIIYTPRVSHFVVEASLEFLSDLLGGPAERRMFEMGIAPPARELNIEFLKPMSWDDEREVTVQVKTVTERSFSLLLTGVVAAATAFTATLSLVCISTETFKPTRIPDGLRSALAGGKS